MSRPSAQRLFAVLVLNVAETERKLEVMKVVLAQQQSFRPLALFQSLDVHHVGYISSVELMDYLRSRDVEVSEEALYSFVKMIDADADGKVTYQDLVEAVLPRAAKDLAAEVVNRPRDIPTHLSQDVHCAVIRLLQEYLATIRLVEQCKVDLVSVPSFNLMDTYLLLDPSNQSFVTPEMFQAYFQSIGQYSNDQNIQALMRLWDKDSDGKVSYLEFIDGVLPSDARYRSAEHGTGQYLTPKKRPKRVSESEKTWARSASVKVRKRSNTSERKSVKKGTGEKRRIMRGKIPRRNLSNAFEEIIGIRSSFSPGSTDLPELAKVLLSQLFIDSKAERTRETLSLRLDFTVLSLFSTLEPHSKGQISVTNLPVAFHAFSLYPEITEFSLLVKVLDRDQDGEVGLKDIETVVTPKAKEYRSVLAERDEFSRKTYEIGIFSIETCSLIRTLFLEIISAELAQETIRQEIVQKGLFSLYKAFSVLDAKSKGFLTTSDFRLFLRRHGKCLTEAELETLMGRYDGDRDGKVMYEDLCVELTPKVPKILKM